MLHRVTFGLFVFVLTSAAWSQVVHTPRFIFNGSADLDAFGHSVSGAGDVNGDGFDDLVVGTPESDNNGDCSGSVFVFSGLDGSVLYTFDGDAAFSRFGWSVSGAGDVNKDGFDDFIVGAYSDDTSNGNSTGSAQVFSGVDGSVLYAFNGDSPGDHFGYSVDGAGDVNNDGYDDLIVGASRTDNTGVDAGSARIFSGFDGSVLYTVNGNRPEDVFGFSVSGAGDVNDDGFDDFIVGAPFARVGGFRNGSAWVFSGIDGSVINIFPGAFPNERLGHSVSGAGDVNNDGFDDYIIGAYLENNMGLISGSARVHSGVAGVLLYTFDGDATDDQFGYSVSGAGDVNGDGFDDVIVGARFNDANETNSGSAKVFSGADGSVLYTFVGDSSDDLFGHSVSGAGDVNADGFDDLIVGAIRDDNNGENSGSARVFASGPFSTPCPGDIDGDRAVGLADLNAVLTAFGQAGPSLVEDLNFDGIVNFADLNEVLTLFGAVCPG